MNSTKENRFWVGKRVGKDDSQERQDVENRSGSAGSGEKAHADHKGEIQAGVVVPANAGCLTRPYITPTSSASWTLLQSDA
jgi:hypothetical protein